MKEKKGSGTVNCEKGKEFRIPIKECICMNRFNSGVMKASGYKFATICSSNVNRSMEAHDLLRVVFVFGIDV